MEARRPAWWNTELPELAARREPMPAVERWQTTYVRYHRAGEAHVAQGGWSVHASRRNIELLARAGQGPMLPEPDTPQAALFANGIAPEAATMRIVEAPSAFALPVKQDRRFSPSFRVRVEVHFRHRVHLPVTVKAYVISQQEKDTILSWTPDEIAPEHERVKPVTELKGTASITHHFEACADGTGPSYGGVRLTTGSASGARSEAAREARILAAESAMYSAAQQQASSPLLPSQFSGSGAAAGARPLAAYPLPGSWGMPDTADASFVEQMMNIGKAGTPGPMQSYGMAPGGYMQQQMSVYPPLSPSVGAGSISNSGAGNFSDVELKSEAGTTENGPPSPTTAGLSAVAHEFDFESLEFLKPSRLNKVYLLFACSVMDLDTLFVVYNVPTVSICRAEQREKACVKLGLPPNAHLAVQRVMNNGGSSMAALHGYDPTPAATPPLSHLSMASTMTHQPMGLHESTAAAAAAAAAAAVGGCEDGDQIPMDALDTGALDTGALDVLFDSPTATPRPSQRKREHGPNLSGLDATQQARQKMGAPMLSAFSIGQSPELEELLAPGWSAALGVGVNGMVGEEQLILPRTRMALREWILEEYDNTGLSRKLTQQDLAALLSQAGFPADVSGDHATISQAQWDEFADQLRAVFTMVRQIAGVWDLEDPVVISGFDMDRLGTVQALRNEPAGTFICRFSMSQPGSLVLTCKVAPGHPTADADALLHALIKVDDLHERRVDAWIRDFVGATHLLDVYRQRRVDKRKVFASNYTRLRGMPLGDNGMNGYDGMGYDPSMMQATWQH